MPKSFHTTGTFKRRLCVVAFVLASVFAIPFGSVRSAFRTFIEAFQSRVDLSIDYVKEFW